MAQGDGFTPYFTVDGARYDFVPTTQWTFAEARLAKQISGGLAVVEIEQRMMLADPEALLAAMVVSIGRVNRKITPDALEQARLMAFFEELTEQAEERSAADEHAADQAAAAGVVVDGPPDVPADVGEPGPSGSGTSTTHGPSGTP